MNWFIRSVMVTLYPRTDAFPGIEDTDVDAFLVRFRRESSTIMWAGVLLGTYVFHSTPIFTLFIPLPAFMLPARLREKHAARILTSRIYLFRQAVFLVKLVGGFCWGAHPIVRKKLGMEPYPADPGTWRQA